jgi:hypothetical protein
MLIQSTANPIANNNSKKIKRKSTKNTFAMAALAAAIPVKPKSAAITDIIKNTIAQ